MVNADKLATIALALAFLTAGAGDSEPALLAILAGLALIFSVASFILK